MNDFTKLSKVYNSNITACKPDKYYSILPTILKILKPQKRNTILDLGCGAGYFTHPLAHLTSGQVIGIDNSPTQLALAKKVSSSKIQYVLADIFNGPLPSSDAINAPFVLNYASSLSQLEHLLQNCFHSLTSNGRLVGVIDIPNAEDQQEKKKYGAIKLYEGKLIDGTVLDILLYSKNQLQCSLKSIFYSPNTILTLLTKVGFSHIQWHSPLISQEGIEVFGQDFWKNYAACCELGYFSATKK